MLAHTFNPIINREPRDESRLYFAQNLKVFREYHGWTLAFVAKQIGVSKTYLWELENDTENKKRPSAIIVCRLSRLFGRGVEELIFLPCHESIE